MDKKEFTPAETYVPPAKRILLGVTGGIAAYKAAELTRLLVKDGHAVTTVLTAAAQEFIGATTFQALTAGAVYTELWPSNSSNSNGMAHINLAREADLLLVAPASADFLAKLAHGLADDLLSTLCLARENPLWVAPAMNQAMWQNPATQRNIAQLQADEVTLLGPANGEQACGEFGPGRMLEPEIIAQAITMWCYPKTLQGTHLLITAGPTFEPIDAARGITNLSSGKMGFSLAQAALEAGATVTLIAGPCSLTTPPGAERINVTSAQEMLRAVEANVDTCDIFLAVAAVADYYVLNPSEQKIKKDAHILTLELAPNPDILANIANRPNAPFCVGFAAESENLYVYAEAKRRRKNVPILVGNLIQHAMGQEESEIVIFDDTGSQAIPRRQKIELARILLQYIAEKYQKRRALVASG